MGRIGPLVLKDRGDDTIVVVFLIQPGERVREVRLLGNHLDGDGFVNGDAGVETALLPKTLDPFDHRVDLVPELILESGDFQLVQFREDGRNKDDGHDVTGQRFVAGKVRFLDEGIGVRDQDGFALLFKERDDAVEGFEAFPDAGYVLLNRFLGSPVRFKIDLVL